MVVEAGKAVLGFGGKMGEPPVSLATTGVDETGSITSIATVGVVPAVVLKKARPTKVSNGKGDRATEMTEGSLSLCIVALEKRGTHPRDPWSSQGGGRIMDARSGNYAWTTET